MKSLNASSMLDDIAQRIKQKKLNNPLLIGIHTGGVWLADELQKRLNLSDPVNSIDITFYRDDYRKIGLQPDVKGSHLPTNMENRDVILIDDVLFTGRTIRAAMNEIFDYGRPDSITLVVLIDRGGRELPIQADIVGKTVILKDNQQIKLTGPEQLSFEITNANTQD